MFAFLTKFKTEVRDFIADASGKLSGIEAKVEQEFADLKAKIEGLFEAKKSDVVASVEAVKNEVATDTSAPAATDAGQPTTDKTSENNPPAA